MQTIDEEINQLISFLSNPAGFGVNMDKLNIRPIYGTIQHWQVDWEYEEDGMVCDFYKIFFTLQEAATFFVEKRRYMCLGLDFNQMAIDGIKGEEL